MSFLSLRDVSFAYPGQAPVLQGLDLDLAAGEIHCLVGRSGCGKTSLLKLAADALLAQLGLAGYGQRHPRQLSGGQQSRVALARALLLQPPLLLLDEPFASLDAITREDLQGDLVRLCRAQANTALFVTHDIAEAVFLGDRVSVLGAGRLVHSLAVPPGTARDTPAFGVCCAALRAALGLELGVKAVVS